MSSDSKSQNDKRSGRKSISPAQIVIIAAVIAGAFAGYAIFTKLGNQTAQGAEGQAGGAGAPPGLPPSTVVVETATADFIQPTYKVIGEIRAVSRAEVAAKEAGAVLEVPVEEGQRVKAGDVIARFDARRIEAQLKEAEAALKSTESRIGMRDTELTRAEKDYAAKSKAFESNAVSERELLDSGQALEVAKSHLKSSHTEKTQAESQIELLTVRLEDSTIVAPFDGYVVARHCEPGEWLNPGDMVATVVSSGKVEAWLEVPERFAQAVRANASEMKVTLSGSGEEVEAINLRLVGDIDRQARTFTVIADLPNNDGRLAPGMSITANIPVGPRSRELALPVDAVIQTGEGSYVMKASQGEGETQIAVRAPVDVVFTSGDRIFARSQAVAEGDLIIVEGNERLFPNSPIVAHHREPAPATAPGETQGGGEGAVSLR